MKEAKGIRAEIQFLSKPPTWCPQTRFLESALIGESDVVG